MEVADYLMNPVLRVLAEIRADYSRDLTVEDMARTASFSKFHFSRVFHRVTGLSPRQFLSAVRLDEAKRLLDSSSLAVADVGRTVGYSSLGSFSSRFKTRVGVSPAAYRRSDRVSPDLTPVRAGPRESGAPVIRGDISTAQPDRPVFVGLFPDRIIQGIPQRCTVLRRAGPFELHDVPAGEWTVMVGAPSGRTADLAARSCDTSALIGFRGPIVVGDGNGDQVADIRLRPMQLQDPPVVLALRDLHSILATSKCGRASQPEHRAGGRCRR